MWTIGLFKTDAIDDGGPAWADRRAVERQVARWVHWDNHQRIHSAMDASKPGWCWQRAQEQSPAASMSRSLPMSDLRCTGLAPWSARPRRGGVRLARPLGVLFMSRR